VQYAKEVVLAILQYTKSAADFAGAKEDSMCRVCEEEYNTSPHPIGRCSALVGKRRKQLGKYLLVPSELRQEHWSSLLKFAKTCERF